MHHYHLKNVYKFVSMSDTIDKIVTSDASWELKFELAFSLMNELNDCDIEYDWNVPDTSYEEDVKAFANTVKEKADELRIVLNNM